ncbi:pitrilysin family protein [Odoribacter sp. Z80]|uniref:M16 family metallopeptidase n=1 Tax=Odoribacter sp. Z80 TaxID=2304575 RepID=UPI001F3FCB16|nr:M16 family metallopeptidase [Odoribacter sp. Z80]
MMNLRIFLFLTCVFLFSGSHAQDLSAPLPADPNMVVGKLPNGITYYLRHNEEPKNRADFYIIRNAGALLENDDQDGLAHFLEHMSFNGTKNFPGKGIITTLEKYGVTFGGNINAYTAQNETVYNISAVPATDVKLLDTCLLILHDWSYYLTLDGDEIDAERGVISEEWRTRRTPQFRLLAQTMPVLFKDSKYAVRDVIGSLDVIKNFKHQTIRDFYHEWYRTDLEAIAVVGDFDVAWMERRIKEIFSSIPAVKNPKPRPFFEIPEHEEMYYCLATDKEVQQSSVSITTILPGAKAEEKNTHRYLKDNLLVSFCNSMIDARIGELMQQANPPFLGGNIGFSGLVRGYDSYGISVSAKPNGEAEALEAILTENERVRRYGFTSTELERVKTNMLVGLEASYKEKDRVPHESFIQSMQAHFLEQEPMVDFEYYYRYVTRLIPTITVEEVNAKFAEGNTGRNRTIVINGPSEGVAHLTREEALAIMDKVSRADIAPYQDEVAEGSLISEDLPGSEVVAEKALPDFEAVEWTLGNGAKVVFRKADYEKEDVALYAYSKGGTSLYDTELLPSATNVSNFASAMGVGDFDAIALAKLLTGKMASCEVGIGNLAETVSGFSSPGDFETMLQLLYLRFEKPRFDREMFESIRNRSRAALHNMGNSPQMIMQDSMSLIMSNYHPRTLLYNEAYIDRLDFVQMERIYRERIKDASDFVFFIVGNINAETVKPLVEKYIGSLKSDYRKETWRDHGVRCPKGKTVKVIELDFETPKATVITSFLTEMKYSVRNNLCNAILKGILNLRYTENIREKEGGTYGVNIDASSSREPYTCYTMVMAFDCDPERADYLKSLIYAETEKIMQEASTTEEFNKVVAAMRKGREQSKPHNSYWMDALYDYYLTGINPADPKNFEEILDKLTPKDIQKFAKSLFKGADVVDLTFRPKK